MFLVHSAKKMCAHHLKTKLDPVTGNRLQLVQSSAGYSKTTARDHWHLKYKNIYIFVLSKIWIVMLSTHKIKGPPKLKENEYNEENSP